MTLMPVSRAVLRFHRVVAPRWSVRPPVAATFSVMRLLTVSAITAMAAKPATPNTMSGRRQSRSTPIRWPPSSGPRIAPMPKEKLMAPTAVAR
ncbi:hypothetical protein D9M69_531260 [compost metagenome]